MTNPGQEPQGHNPFGSDPFAGSAFGQTPGAGPPVLTAPPGHPGAPQSPVNTLATLSVIFAFVFAPAGAVLGHLGLSQVARTRERGRDRALIGLTLSYGIIALTAVAVTIWLVTGSTGRAPTAAPSSRAAAPVTPSAPKSGPPPPPPAPTVAPASLAGLLPSAEEMKALTGVASLTLAETRTNTASVLDGTADKPNCLSAVGIGDPRAYDPAAVRGFDITRYPDHQYSGSNGLAQSDQSVAAYADATAATSARDAMVANWRSCGGSTTNYSTAQVTVPLAIGVPTDGGPGITTTRIDWGNSKIMPLILNRVIAAKANIIVEVTVTGTTSDRTQIAMAVANAILNRIPS